MATATRFAIVVSLAQRLARLPHLIACRRHRLRVRLVRSPQFAAAAAVTRVAARARARSRSHIHVDVRVTARRRTRAFRLPIGDAGRVEVRLNRLNAANTRAARARKRRRFDTARSCGARPSIIVVIAK